MSGPLQGLKIIEFAGLGPGPFCGMMVADHGAEVLHKRNVTRNAIVEVEGRAHPAPTPRYSVTRVAAPKSMISGAAVVEPVLRYLGLDAVEIERDQARNIVS